VSVRQAGSLGMVSVSAVDPTTTYQVMLDELRHLQDTPLTPERLAGAKSTFLTSIVNDAEATDGQANLLAIGALYTGDLALLAPLPRRGARGDAGAGAGLREEVLRQPADGDAGAIRPSWTRRWARNSSAWYKKTGASRRLSGVNACRQCRTHLPQIPSPSASPGIARSARCHAARVACFASDHAIFDWPLVCFPIRGEVVLDLVEALAGVLAAVLVAQLVGRRIVFVAEALVVVRLVDVVRAPVLGFRSRVDRFAGRLAAESAGDRADRAARPPCQPGRRSRRRLRPATAPAVAPMPVPIGCAPVAPLIGSRFMSVVVLSF
jgi:hypothetical protein